MKLLIACALVGLKIHTLTISHWHLIGVAEPLQVEKGRYRAIDLA